MAYNLRKRSIADSAEESKKINETPTNIKKTKTVRKEADSTAVKKPRGRPSKKTKSPEFVEAEEHEEIQAIEKVEKIEKEESIPVEQVKESVKVIVEERVMIKEEPKEAVKEEVPLIHETLKYEEISISVPPQEESNAVIKESEVVEQSKELGALIVRPRTPRIPLLPPVIYLPFAPLDRLCPVSSPIEKLCNLTEKSDYFVREKLADYGKILEQNAEGRGRDSGVQEIMLSPRDFLEDLHHAM